MSPVESEGLDSLKRIDGNVKMDMVDFREENRARLQGNNFILILRKLVDKERIVNGRTRKG